MSWAVLIVRLLVGLTFTATGLNDLLPKRLFDIPPPPAEAVEARAFLKLLHDSHYLTAVKVLELSGGLLLLSGRAAPLGITLVTPVAVNILLYEIFLLRTPGPGYALVPMLAFLIWAYRRYFSPVFTVSASAGGPSWWQRFRRGV